MPITLSSGFDPSVALRSAYSTPTEDAAVAAQMEQERVANMGLAGRALTRGLYNAGSGIADAGAQIVEPFAPQFSQPVFDWAGQQRDLSKGLYAPTDVMDYTNVHGVGDLGNYVANKGIENIPNMLPAMVGGVAARVGLRGAALSPFAKTAIGGTIAAFPQQMGEGVGALREDPTIMANTTPMQRVGASAAYGAATAPLESLPDSLLANRLMGAGAAVKNVFKDGIKATAKDAAKHVALGLGESALTEGVPEALEQKGQQLLQSHYNPSRDTSRDEHDLKESFFGGWAAGGGSSMVGRGADVAWAQGRGATDALKGLIKDKLLPANLKNSDDQTIVGWDKEDDAQRNSFAKDLADRILNSDASQKMKDAATAFYEKASQGASDAWQSIADPIRESDKFQSVKDSVDRFAKSVKYANDAVSGEKNNAEETPADKAAYGVLRGHLDPNIYNNKFEGSTEVASKLYQSLKKGLIDAHGDPQKLDEGLWHELGKSVLGDKNVGQVVADVRDKLVQHGELAYDEHFMDAFKKVHEGQISTSAARAEMIRRYSPHADEIGKNAGVIANRLYDQMRNYHVMTPGQKAEFDAQTRQLFGWKKDNPVSQQNYETAMEAFRPTDMTEHAADTSEGTGITEVDPTKDVFIGSADKSVRRTVADGSQDNSIQGHGGFFKLGSKADGDKSITKRFNDLQADLRKDGHYVKALTPLEYAEASGISPGKIAGHLGTSIAGLKDHPARILQVEKRDMEKDKLSLDHDDLLSLSDKTSKTLSGLPDSVQIKEPERIAAIKAALGLNKKGEGGKQRKAMRDLGLEHGTKLRTLEDGRTFLQNNKLHGGNGIFNVHMEDGTTHRVSAQHLIETMRTRGNGEVSSRSAYRMFAAGIAAVQSMEGVKSISVDDIWGRRDDHPFHGVTNSKSYFKLTGNLTLGSAHKASSRGNLKTQVMRLEGELEALQDKQKEMRAQLKVIPVADKKGRAALKGDLHRLADKITSMKEDIADAKEEAEAFQKEIEGDGDRPGVVSNEGKPDTRTHDFNDDGSPVQPYGKDTERSVEDRKPLPFNGHALRLRQGVRARDLTGDAKVLLGVIKAVRGLIGNEQLTGKLDMALDLIGRSASANKDSNAKAREALLGMAASAIKDAVAEEMFAAHEAALQRPSEDLTDLRKQYAALRNFVAKPELISLAAKYLDNQAKADEQIGQYMPPKWFQRREKKDAATTPEMAGDRVTHHDIFLATLEGKTNEEIAHDGVARAKRIEHYSKFTGEKMEELVDLMQREQEIARKELRARKSGEKTRKVTTEPVKTPVGTANVPTQAATKAQSEIRDRQELLKENLTEQRRLEGATPNRVNKKNLADLKANEATLRAEIRDLIPTSKETEESTVISRNSKTEPVTAKVETEEEKKAALIAREQTAWDKLQEKKASRALARKSNVAAEQRAATLDEEENSADERNAADAEREARTKQAETHEKAFEKALTDVEKLKGNVKGVAKALRAAYGNLKQAFVEGELNNKELVANLRAAMAAFSAAVGDAARMVRAAVQQFIKEYQAAKVAPAPETVEQFNAESAALHKELGKAGFAASDAFQEFGLVGHSYPSNRNNNEKPNYVIYDDSRIETNFVQFNAEGSFASGQGVTPEQMAEVEAYIAKTLGPDVIASLVKDLGGNSAAWNRKGGKAYIRIAINALNPTSKAHHEAMHEFFQRLMENNPEAAEVLRNAAKSPAVVRQIERFFNQDANYAKIKAALAADEHERVAYMFQLWAAGKLNVGPQTKTWFGKVAAALRKVFGIISDSEQAEAIMEHFHNGEMSNQNDVARVLAKDPAAVAAHLKRAAEYAAPLTEKAKELFYTSQNMLTESGNKGFEKIGRMFSTETGREGEAISFFDAKTMKTNQYNDHLWNIIRKEDEGDLAAALKGLQEGVKSNDPKIAKIQGSIHKMLDHIHGYMGAKGMKVGKLDNYFPRVWDSLAIADKKAEFIKMLQDDHLKTKGKPLNVDIATKVAESIIDNRGAEPLNEDELAAGYTPFMAAGNKRVLDFITNPEFSKFQEQSIQSILTTYIAQAVHKAEYTERFGEHGEKLGNMILNAVGEEVGPDWTAAHKAADAKLKKLTDKLKAEVKAKTKTSDEANKELAAAGYQKGRIQPKHVAAELTDKTKFNDFEPKLRRMVRSIMAMEGTLGAEINPKLRKLQAALIVYTNLRTLSMSLFSQVIDPLGVIIRGGTANQAWDTFKYGVEGVIAGWKGKAIDSKEYDWARQLGIVDAGAYLNSQGNAYASVFLGKTAQKINDKLFRWNGVEGAAQGTRVGAMIAAMDFIKTHSTLPEKHSERWLKELNLTPADITIKGDELDLSNPKIQQAIFRWVESAILRPNASMRPSWASDPHFALVFHMKQFTYAMQKVILERVMNEAEHGNLEPAAAMLLTYVPAMMAADFLRGLLANGGQEPPWKRKWKVEDYLWNGVQRAGLLGVGQFGLDAAQWGPAELLGPMAGQVTHAGKTLIKDIEKDIDLDIKASTTGQIRDIERAASYNGVTAAAKKTLRDALPINSIAKHYVYDEVIGK